MEAGPLILTLRLDGTSQRFFDQLREEHFPKERNFLKAHLSLFHQLPANEHTTALFQAIDQKQFDMAATGLLFLGFGVAYRIESAQLLKLRGELASAFLDQLIPQDRQPYRPHITIQNKVAPETAKELKIELEKDFKPITITATGLDLWTYLGGSWEHHSFYPFSPA